METSDALPRLVDPRPWRERAAITIGCALTQPSDKLLFERLLADCEDGPAEDESPRLIPIAEALGLLPGDDLVAAICELKRERTDTRRLLDALSERAQAMSDSLRSIGEAVEAKDAPASDLPGIVSELRRQWQESIEETRKAEGCIESLVERVRIRDDALRQIAEAVGIPADCFLVEQILDSVQELVANAKPKTVTVLEGQSMGGAIEIQIPAPGGAMVEAPGKEEASVPVEHGPSVRLERKVKEPLEVDTSAVPAGEPRQWPRTSLEPQEKIRALVAWCEERKTPAQIAEELRVALSAINEYCTDKRGRNYMSLTPYRRNEWKQTELKRLIQAEKVAMEAGV